MLKITITSLLLCLSCATGTSAQEHEGVYVRLLDVLVAPEDSRLWEAAVEEIAHAARLSELDSCCDWLLYRQGAYRYRVIFFSDGLSDLVTPEIFANAFIGTPGEKAYLEAVVQLKTTQYEVVDDVVHQIVGAWSTVDAMSTDTHPKGRLTKYWVRPGEEDAFDAAMQAYMALLKEVKYPYPVEGFQWRVGSPGVNYIAVFPDSWTGFFGEHDVHLVVDRHNRRPDYDALLRQIANTVYRVEQQDIDFEPRLSY